MNYQPVTSVDAMYLMTEIKSRAWPRENPRCKIGFDVELRFSSDAMSNSQRNVLGKGNSAEIGGGNEENGKEKQFSGPENEGVFGAEFVKCHIPDAAIVAAEM